MVIYYIGKIIFWISFHIEAEKMLYCRGYFSHKGVYCINFVLITITVFFAESPSIFTRLFKICFCPLSAFFARWSVKQLALSNITLLKKSQPVQFFLKTKAKDLVTLCNAIHYLNILHAYGAETVLMVSFLLVMSRAVNDPKHREPIKIWCRYQLKCIICCRLTAQKWLD